MEGMNLGMPEMIFIFLLALVVFGPRKLPELGREIGKFMAEFKRASNDFKNQIESEIDQINLEEERKKLQEASANLMEDAQAFSINPPENAGVAQLPNESVAIAESTPIDHAQNGEVLNSPISEEEKAFEASLVPKEQHTDFQMTPQAEGRNV